VIEGQAGFSHLYLPFFGHQKVSAVKLTPYYVGVTNVNKLGKTVTSQTSSRASRLGNLEQLTDLTDRLCGNMSHNMVCF
jgi:hypothetical protein